MAPKVGYLLPTREAVMQGKPAARPLLTLAERAEELGYDSLWIGDSLIDRPRHEPLVMLAGVAGRTSRVLLEMSVHDKLGRFVSGLAPSSFAVTEDGVPQEIDLVDQETLPATFALLIDSSQSMSRRIDFVRDAARRFIRYLRPKDQVLVAPFTR